MLKVLNPLDWLAMILVTACVNWSSKFLYSLPPSLFGDLYIHLVYHSTLVRHTIASYVFLFASVSSPYRLISTDRWTPSLRWGTRPPPCSFSTAHIRASSAADLAFLKASRNSSTSYQYYIDTFRKSPCAYYFQEKNSSKWHYMQFYFE